MKHELPKLDYPVERGVPPAITATQLNFHYNKHHKTYVDKLNGLVAGTEFESQPLDQIIKKTAFDQKLVPIFNNAAQHFNHAFYWKCMKPNSGTEEHPMPDYLSKRLQQQFGSVEEFKKQFTEKSVALFGSGWCWLVFDGTSLKIWTGSNAQCPIAQNMVPLLTCDVWEHAYYLDYQNRRPDYLNTWWKVVNWDFVDNTMKEAEKVFKASNNL